MPHDLNQCPDASLLQQFLDGGGLTDAALPWTGEILERHLNECPTCQQRLERLVAGQESWEGAARLLAGIEARKEAVTETPALRELMDHEQDQIPEALEGCSATAPSLAPLSLDFLQPSNQTDSLGRLGDYEVLEVVGRGGMGVVLKAYDPSLRRIVAIKVMAAHLASSPMARKRFIREARAAAAVSHDHVVAIYAVEEHHEPPFIVMQYIRGKTLHERLATTGPLSVTEVLRIGMQTAAGLAAAHAQGLVHRDIKPANILLENGVERVKITDFGLARAVDDVGMTQTGIVAGTPQFMAPEQANGEAIDLRSDLFSLGSVLYMLCTGRPPFRATTMMGLLKRICDETPPPIRDLNPEIPGWLEEIITKLLAKRPCDRFQSAQEVAELLGHWLAHVQRPLNVPCPAPLLKATDFSASTDQTETNGEPAANSSANTDIAARMSVFSGGYSRTAPFSGHVEQTFERALAVLTTAGFQLKQRTDCQMNLTGPGLNGLKQNPLAAASTLRLSYLNGSLRLQAELGTMQNLHRMLMVFPIPFALFALLNWSKQFGPMPTARSSWPETILCGIFAALIALSIMFSRRAIRMRFDSFFENLIPPPSVPTVNQHAAPGKPESWRVRFEKRLREAYPTRVYWISMAIWGLWMVPILDSSQTFHAFIHWLAIAFITLSLTWVLAVVTYAWRQKVRSGKWESTILRGTPRRFLMQPMSFLFVGAGLYWTWQQAICGTIAFDINDRDFTVSLTGPSLNSNQNFSADFYPLRVRAGNYRWEVRHGSDPIDMGELEVTPGQTQTIQIRSPFPIGEADAACLPGRWGYHWCVGGNSMSIASRKQANTEIPGYVDISMDGNSQFELRSHTSVISDCLDALSGMAAASVSKSGASPESVYTIQVSSPANHERGPKWIDLLHHETDKGKQTVVAQGIFAADTKTLSLRLVPANSERPTWSSSFSDNCISLSFERASDRTLLQGEWNSTTPVDVVTDSPKPNSDKAGVNPNYHLPARMSFIGDRFEVRPTDRAPGKIDAGTFRLDPTQKPKRITLFRTPQKGTIQISEGIYRFDGDQLTLSINDHAEVPRDFEPLPNLKEHRLLKLQRVKE